MKVLIFGDIHGNLIALEKLFEVEKNKYDIFVCHGDIVNYGPWGNECLEFLLQRKDNGVFLKGNHEEYYINGVYPGKNEVAKSFFKFCFPKFEKKYLDSISQFKEFYTIGNFTIMHSIEGQYIFKDTDIENLSFKNNTIVGHSHQQFHRIVHNRNLYNTGSLGQNRTFLNKSEYLVVDTEKKIVELKSFLFDIKKVISEMENQKYPEICLNYYKSKKTIDE